jgi:hypothetical protein
MVAIRDPISGKIVGNKTVEFKEDKKAEQKMDEYKLEPVESKEEQEPIKNKGGRPKGIHTPLNKQAVEDRSTQKKKFDKVKYKDNPVCKLINVTTYSMINKTFLSDKIEKLTIDDMEKISFGESIMYVIDYYAPKGLNADHPILILGIAMLGLGIKTVELKSKKIEGNKVVF